MHARVVARNILKEQSSRACGSKKCSEMNKTIGTVTICSLSLHAKAVQAVKPLLVTPDKNLEASEVREGTT